MQGRSGTAVTGVHGGQQMHHLRATALTDHEPIRAHTQRLHNQLTQPDFARTLGVGGTGFEGNNLLMQRREFRGVFEQNEALLRHAQPQQGVEQGGFAGAGAPANEESAAFGNHAAQIGGGRLITQPGGLQLRQGGALAGG